MALAIALLISMAQACGATPAPARAPHCSTHRLVGLVTDAPGEVPGSRNSELWAGLQKAAADPSLCFRSARIDSSQPADYAGNLAFLGQLRAALVVASSPALAGAAATAARAYPATRYAVIGQAADGTLPNLIGVNFRADQAAMLAGAVAGLFTRSNAVGGIYGRAEQPVIAYRAAFERGARYVNAAVRVYGVYQPPGPGFDDPSFAAARSDELVAQGADVLFSAGRPGQAGLMSSAAAHGRACIGFEVDQYAPIPESHGCLLTSAIFRYSVAAEGLVRSLAAGGLRGPNLTFDAAAGGIGLAPFHDFERSVSPDLRRRIQEFQRQLASGRVQP